MKPYYMKWIEYILYILSIIYPSLHLLYFVRQPYQQAVQVLHKFLITPQYLPQERLAVIEKLTFEDVCDVLKSNLLLNGISLDSLIQGNITEDEAKKLLISVGKIMSPEVEGTAGLVTGESNRNGELVPAKVVDLRDRSKDLVRVRARQMAANTEEKNSAVVLAIQVRSNYEILKFLSNKHWYPLFYLSLFSMRQIASNAS